jgi:Domain of unknown function (DUF4372)/Transposase DDE domain
VHRHFLAEAMRPDFTQEGKVMVAVASLFNQLLQHFPRTEFAALVRKHKAERRAKGFTCWTQFVSMLFCQLAHAGSLRDICNGLSCSLGKLVHLGIHRSPNKSTLSYANEKRPASLFEDLFWTVLDRFRSDQSLGGRQNRFRFKNKLLSLDSTTISLCLSLFPWAKFKTAKGGVKAHVLLDHDDYMPRFVLVTDAKCPDVKVAHSLSLNPGSIIVMDLGYIDYQLFAKWTKAGIFFVTRLRKDLNYVSEQNRSVPQYRNILEDETIRFNSKWGRKYCRDLKFRRIVVDIEGEEPLVLLTNHRTFGATTIANIYKDRWQIEVFFKALKQNLKIKSFVGTSPNAIYIQIWTALIAMLLLKWLHYLSKAKWSLSNLATMLRLNLFTYRELQAWLDQPFSTPPVVPLSTQLNLELTGFGQLPEPNV